MMFNAISRPQRRCLSGAAERVERIGSDAGRDPALRPAIVATGPLAGAVQLGGLEPPTS